MKKIVYSVLMTLAFAFTTTAQNTTVSGTVKSSVDGLPLIGVNVIVKDTSTGAVSDFDGNFTQPCERYDWHCPPVRSCDNKMKEEITKNDKKKE